MHNFLRRRSVYVYYYTLSARITLHVYHTSKRVVGKKINIYFTVYRCTWKVYYTCAGKFIKYKIQVYYNKGMYVRCMKIMSILNQMKKK